MRLIFPILMGVVGVAVLCGLGLWQLQRLETKSAIIAAIDSRIGADPVTLPARPDAESDRYLPVTVSGRLPGLEAHVLTSTRAAGPGYRIVAVMDTTGGRRILVDLGFVPQADKDASRRADAVTITGNLHWPNETDRWTAPPDPANIWFARDVPRMAAALGTEEVLVVARQIVGAPIGTQLMPVDSATVPNDHLNYAITWFSLAAVWAAMSVALVLRQRRAA